ncbi:TadG family pilus assembly protein [Paraburkholderia adhaesiva]|uniref:TadG family pilus assembly protein n=1 Tax=Paraburkholderia adhaesiva TaxID=2883244 RepID=UPI001F24FE11|nr:TadG family pilus assembly protein [Paraburkholderia adhaesiva]
MRSGSRAKQKGAVAVTVALSMVAMLSFAALAIDIGNLMVARNELQNAADAAALAGAGCLKPRSECGNSTATQPDWTTAAARASTFSTATTSNKVQGAYPTASTVATGYWNATGTPYGLEALPFTPGPNDLPAVRVTIRKDGSDSNGAVPVFLASVFGATFLKASAVATAVLSSPGNVGAGGLFPLAMSQCLFNTYWNTSTDSPSLSPTSGTVTGFSDPQVAGQPYIFRIGSSYQYSTCQSGQWTTFDSNDQSASFAKNLVTNGNTTTFSVNGSNGTWIQSGEENSVYNTVHACSAAGNGQCEWVTVVVVADPSATGSTQTVQAFACLHILDAQNGSNPYVEAQMSNDMSHCETDNSGGVGPSYGAYTPPRLVQ